MLEEVVKVITKKIISSDYPHLKTPSVVFARIDSVKICGTFEADDYRQCFRVQPGCN